MASKAALSEEEYLRTSYSGVDREFRDGDLVERSVPNFAHGRMAARLAAFFESNRVARNVHSAVETRIRLRTGRYVIPDVCVFWPEEPIEEIPESLPLLVIEVLSPDDRMSDVMGKLREYHEAGVAHVWLADPKLRLLYLYRDGLQEVTSAQIPEVNLELRLADLFA
jgi:Uma2 family endonuclease